MVNKIIPLLISVLLILITINGASAFSNTSAFKYAYTCSSASTSCTNLGVGAHNITFATGIGTATGGYDKVIYFTGTTSNASFPNFEDVTVNSFYFRYYLNSSTQDASGFLYEGNTGSGPTWRIMYYAASGWNFQNFKLGGGYNCNNDVAVGAQDTWHSAWFVVNSTGCAGWIDGVMDWSASTNDLSDVDGGLMGTIGKLSQDATVGMRFDELAYLPGFQPTNADILETNSTSIGNYFTASPTAFSITARDTLTLGTLNILNATISSVTYTTTNGTVNTPYNSSSGLLTITVNAGGYVSNVYTNWNTSTNLIANLTPQNISDFSIVTPNASSTSNTTYTISWTNATSPTNKGVNYSVSVYYVNGTFYKTLTTVANALSYLWTETNESMGMYTIKVNATEDYTGKTYTHNTTLTLLPASDYIRIYAFNYLGTSLLTNIQTYDNYTTTLQTTNPFEKDIMLYLNTTLYKYNQTIGINVTDLSLKHRNYVSNITITRFNTTFNITLDPNQLVLTFYDEGALKHIRGVLHHESLTNGTYAFNGTSMLVVQQSLAEGYVQVKMGLIGTPGENWTQYYEYINDYETHITEDIEILSQANWGTYFEILDPSNAPIKDAVIRVYYGETQDLNWTNFKLLGQRLSKDDGKTFFITDDRTELYVVVTKDGYEASQRFVTTGDSAYSTDSPIQIYLYPGESTVDRNAWMYVPRSFTNRTNDIKGTITAIGRDRVQIQTDYRVTQGLAKLDITDDCDDFNRCIFTLDSGTDFLATGVTDITLYVYFDSSTTSWRNITIDFDESTKTRVGNEISQTESRYLNPLLVIMMVLIPVLIGLLFRSANSGTWTFMGLGIVSGMVSTSFLWLTVLCSLYVTFRLLQKVISE